MEGDIFLDNLSYALLGIMFLAQIMMRSSFGIRRAFRPRDEDEFSSAHLRASVFYGRMVMGAWAFGVAGVLASVGYRAWMQYAVWAEHPFTKLFLPPYQGFDYFWNYAGTRLVANSLIAFAAAILVGSAAHFLNKKFGERYLHEEEGRLFSLGILLSGYPGFFVYIALMLLAGIVLALAYAILRKGRAPLLFLWLPVAACAIVITNYAIPQVLLGLFNL